MLVLPRCPHNKRRSVNEEVLDSVAVIASKQAGLPFRTNPQHATVTPSHGT